MLVPVAMSSIFQMFISLAVGRDWCERDQAAMSNVSPRLAVRKPDVGLESSRVRYF